MKTSSNKHAPKIATGTEIPQLIKSRLTILKLLVILVSTVMTTAVFGQATFTWTNQNPLNSFVGDLGLATNYSPNGVPSSQTGPDGNGVYGDIIEWSGATTGNMVLTSNTGQTGGSGNPVGLRFHLTSAQTSSVMIYAPIGLGTASGGTRLQGAQIEAGAGGLILGDNFQNTNILDFICGGVNGQIQGFTNNSTTAPSIINPAVRFRMGGAGAHTHVFEGPGDWIINNHLRSANSSTMIIQKGGSGTMTWTGTNVGAQAQNWFDLIGSPFRITGGTVILKTSDLLTAAAGSPGIANNGTLLKYDVQPTPGLVTGPATIPGVISGTGTLEIHAGTLTLAGASTFTGPINLTGGELIAGSTESVGASGPLGQGGTISFNGGTLGWSLANAFDYSSRFDTSPNQVYNLDTGGASPILATGLTSSGGTLNKLGGGTLTLAGANTYSGPTTVAASGGLVFQGTKSGSANITIADTATLGVFENGSQITPTTLTLGTSTGAALEFNNVTNHSVATLAPNNLVSVGTVIISVNSGAFFNIGDTFPLISWTSGTAPATTLGFLAGAGGHLTTNGNQINLVIDDPPYIWTGAADAIWNTTSIDWIRSGSPVTWVNGHYALLDDSAGANTNLTLSGTIMPTNATISSSLPFAITNSAGNVLGGPGGLTKSGAGTLILPGGANTYTGPTTIGGGLLEINVLANGGVASDIGAANNAAGNIVFRGGTLQYTGPGASIDRLFSVGPGGGTIDNEGPAALVFNNSGVLGMPGNGPRTLILTGPGTAGDTLGCNLTNHPAGTSLTKSGTGLWILTGDNSYAGGTALLEGSLQVGTGGTGGALGSGSIATAAGTSIDFQRSGSLLVPGAISGNASVAVDGTGTVILANNNTYNGGTTINTGTLQVGNGGGTGSLLGSGGIVNNSLLIFNTAGSFSYQGAGLISGSGNVIFRGGGLTKAIGANSYTGWTFIDTGTTFFCREGQDGALATSVITNNGTLRMVDQNNPGFSYGGAIVGSGRVQVGANNFNVGLMTLTGTNTYTGGTFIGDNTLVLGDGINPTSGSITGNVQFVNNFTTADDNVRTLTFNRPDDFTFGGTITTNFSTPQNNRGVVQQSGTGTLTLTGNNTYGGGTVVAFGSVKVGNGGSSGSLGFGTVALNSGSPLVINRSGSMTPVGNISGAAELYITGGATVTLNGVNNTYSGVTTVSNGTLIVNGTNVTASTTVWAGGLGGAADFTGPVTATPATTFSPGVANALGTFTVENSLTLDSSNIVVDINKFATPTSDFVNVTTTLARTATGGTLTVHNRGPNNLVPGDTFTLFSQPLPNGGSMTIVGARATWVNNLAVNGSISVSTLITTQPPLNFTTTSTNMTFSWSDPYNSFKLQVQTNSLTGPWFDYPGGGSSPITVPIDRTKVDMFFRLLSIP